MKKIIFAFLTLSMTSAFCGESKKGALCRDAAVNLAKAVATVENVEGKMSAELEEMKHGGDNAGKFGSEKWRVVFHSTTTIETEEGPETYEHGTIYDIELRFSDDLKCEFDSISKIIAG